MDFSKVPENLTRELDKILIQIKKHVEKQNEEEQAAMAKQPDNEETSEIVMDFKNTKEGQNNYLVNQAVNLRKIDTLIITNYMFSEPVEDVRPLFGRIKKLEIKMSNVLRISEAEYQPFFAAMHSLEILKMRKIVPTERNKNICDCLPNDTIQRIDYKIEDDLNWSFVINEKIALQALKCEIKALPNFRHPIGKITNLDVEINARNIFTYVMTQINTICKFVKGEHLQRLTLRTTDLMVARELLFKLSLQTQLKQIKIIELNENGISTGETHLQPMRDRLMALKGIGHKQINIEKPEYCDDQKDDK